MAAGTPGFPSIDETIGAASIGFSISCGLFGILVTLIYIYFDRFPNDKITYKLLVASLGLLELVDQIFIGYSIYYYTVTQYGKPHVLFTEDIVWPLMAQVVVGNSVGSIVKFCFGVRVWRFSHHNWYITAPIFTLIFVQMGCAMAFIIKGFQLNQLLFVGKLKYVATIALSSGMATDAIIAIALCVLLHKLRTGFKKSDTIINTLIIYAVNTGALTGFFGFLTVLVYNLFPSAFYFMTFYFFLGKLYAISFIATLNTRKSVRGKGTDQQVEDSSNNSAPRGTVFLVSPTASRGTASRGKSGATSAYMSNQMGLDISVQHEVSVLSDLERQSPSRIKFETSR